MTSVPASHPLPAEDLIGYAIRELEEPRRAAVEEHLFECEACSRALDAVVRLGAGIAACIAEARVGAPVTVDLLRRVVSTGGRVREYRVSPGQTVACTAGPDDRFLAIRLGGVAEGMMGLTLDIELHALGTGQRHVRYVEDVPVDAASREIVLLMPGELMRAYPRSRWTLAASGVKAGEPVRFEPYVFDHTPWEELQPSDPRRSG